MRILMINDYAYLRDAPEYHMFAVRDALEKRGHEVAVAGAFREPAGIPRAPSVLDGIYSSKRAEEIQDTLEDFQPDAVHMFGFSEYLSPLALRKVLSWRGG